MFRIALSTLFARRTPPIQEMQSPNANMGGRDKRSHAELR